MQIKFKKNLFDYKYLVMFDLASRVSGVCLWDLTNNKPLETFVIKVKDTVDIELPIIELNRQIDEFFKNLNKRGISLKDVVVSCEAAPLQAGKFTTAQTLISLGKAHATLDLYCVANGIDVYDYIGIAPITWHSYFKKIMGLDRSIEKEDVHDYVVAHYDLDPNLTLDESDSVFLAQTLIEKHWDDDIAEAIREEKRHIKGDEKRHIKPLKAPHAIKACEDRIEALKQLKINK